MKRLLICSLLSLLSSCSLLEKTPSSVINGQKSIYQGIIVLEENANKIIDRYVEDTKASVTYHLHFVCEKTIQDLVEEYNDSEYDNNTYVEQRSDYHRKKRDQKISKAHADIDKIAKQMRRDVSNNHIIIKKLTAAIYNHMSTTPIEVDNLDFWVDRLSKLRKINE